MNDLSQWYGDDLAASPTGDLAPIAGTVRGQQRVLRRLLTNPAQRDANGTVVAPGDYLWHPDYGAGLPQWIGRTLDIPKITALIKGQMRLEDCVAQTPEPVITVAPIDAGMTVDIQYVDNDAQTTQFLSFNVTA
jgi:hypothetical protein